jgi:hypothetical protein
MSIADAVKMKLAGVVAPTHESTKAMARALADAERLADMFADVKPVPFVVPFERFAGLPYEKPLHNYAC